MRIMWLAGALASSLLMVGCARDAAKMDQAKLGRLPIEQKQEVFTAEHNVSVAQTNKAAAERAKDQAQLFMSMADEEVAAAKSRVNAAKNALDLAHRANSTSEINAANRAYDLANKQLIASVSKKEYANRLVDLRDAQIELADKQVDAAQADLAFLRANSLRANGIAPSQNEADLMRDRDEKMRELALQERNVATTQDTAERYRFAWEQNRQEYNVAAREQPGLPPIKPPPSPPRFPSEKTTPPEPLPSTPAPSQ